MKYTIAIVGGGITGLTTAHRIMSLKKKENLPLELVLLESSGRLGGVIKSESVGDFIIEHGPDAFLTHEPEFKQLLEELDLVDQLIPTNIGNRKAFVAQRNNLIPLPAGFFMIAPTNWWSFINSPLFSLAAKLRISIEPFVHRRKNLMEDESVGNFLRRRFGVELLTRAGQPLIGSIYMADINLLSAQSTIPQFIRLEQEFGSVIKGLIRTGHQGANTASGARYNLFSSFKDGTAMLIEKLSQQLSDAQICLNTQVLSLNRGQGKTWMLITNYKPFEADAVVFALPAKLAAGITHNFDISLSNNLAAIESSNSIVVNLLYKQSDLGRRYQGFGFVVPTSEHKQIIASGFISQKFPNRASTDQVVIRVFLGGQLMPQLFDLSDQELTTIAHNEIAPYLKIKNPPRQSWLNRCPASLPIYQTGHKQTLEKIENCRRQYPGLMFTGASYHGLGIPDCVRQGEATASVLLESIRQRTLTCLKEIV